MNLERISAFSYQGTGGNPAGVAICDNMPTSEEMLNIAKEVGYSETAFLVKQNDTWRIRYFAPEMEIPFCGHATIASGACLAEHYGLGEYQLILNNGSISVNAEQSDSGDTLISLQSPPTWSKPAPETYVKRILEAFSIDSNQLDPELPIKLAHAGANHLIIAVEERSILASMDYPFESVKKMMAEQDLITINLVYKETTELFHSRNAFAAGGVIEDPATGAATAALAGYLRDLQWPVSSFEVLQGFDMGSPSQLFVEFPNQAGASIKVSGSTYQIK